MARRYRRSPNREERLARWQQFLDACSEEERARFTELAGELRAGYQAHCEQRGSQHQFGVDSSIELLVALVDWIQFYRRTCRVRKGMKR